MFETALCNVSYTRLKQKVGLELGIPIKPGRLNQVFANYPFPEYPLLIIEAIKNS